MDVISMLPELPIRRMFGVDLREFEFHAHGGPIAKLEVAIGTVAVYLATLWLIKQYVDRFGAWKLKMVEITHNYFLSAASALLLLGMVLELDHMIANSSLMSVLTDYELKHTQKGLIIFYYWINYILKYVELFDTVLLAMRGKPMTFLHVFHHSATLLLSWVQLNAETCVQWAVITLNLTVHVFMYAYYAHAAR